MGVREAVGRDDGYRGGGPLEDETLRSTILPGPLCLSCTPTSRAPIPRLTDHSEVDLRLPAAQLALHQQRVAAAVLLARRQDGELAAALAVLHLDVLALLDLRAEGGQALGTWARNGRGSRSPLPTPKGMQLQKLWGSPQEPSSAASEPSHPEGCRSGAGMGVLSRAGGRNSAGAALDRSSGVS